jgi:EAL domain-containing protein (putative c-di-GMP-specific phosphodiesterase class I)/GGDEF domain-containing protein
MGDWKRGSVDPGGPLFDLELAIGPAWLIDLARRRIVDANAAALALWSTRTVDELSAFPVEAAFFDELLSQFALGLGAGALVPTRLKSPTRDDIPSVDCLAVPARLHDGGPGLILEAIALNGELVTVYDGTTGLALLRNQRAANAAHPDERAFADRFVDKDAADRLWRAVAERASVSPGERRQRLVASAALAVRAADGVVVHEVRLSVLAGEGPSRVVAEERPVTRDARSPAASAQREAEPAAAAVTGAGAGGLAARSGALPGAGEGTLLLVTITGFEGLLEDWGEEFTRDLLATTARRLWGHVRPSDAVEERAGGRFVALLPGLTDRTVLDRRIDQILRHLSMPIAIGGSTVIPGVQIGFAVWPRQGASLDVLERAAEPADTGGTSVRTPILRRRASGVVAGRDELKQAIEAGEIEAFFQPLIGLDDGRVIGCEALARWRRPRTRLMTAAKFIASVEAAGLIWPLGDVILRHALRQVGAWTAQGLGAGGRIAVNIGAQQLTNVAIVDHIQACLADAGLSAQHLAVEVTEAIALGPAGDLVLERLNALHDLGVEVVLDDFGTGHASLALLERLPVNRVKIDRTVVAGIDVVPSCKPIIRTVTDLAHSLSLQVVAEGVETREQMHFLQLCGCDGGQGNLFAPPMSGGEATSWLAARASAATSLGASALLSEIAADIGSGIGGRGRLH